MEAYLCWLLSTFLKIYVYILIIYLTVLSLNFGSQNLCYLLQRAGPLVVVNPGLCIESVES